MNLISELNRLIEAAEKNIADEQSIMKQSNDALTLARASGRLSAEYFYLGYFSSLSRRLKDEKTDAERSLKGLTTLFPSVDLEDLSDEKLRPVASLKGPEIGTKTSRSISKKRKLKRRRKESGAVDRIHRKNNTGISSFNRIPSRFEPMIDKIEFSPEGKYIVRLTENFHYFGCEEIICEKVSEVMKALNYIEKKENHG